jgi:hypothetical protein
MEDHSLKQPIRETISELKEYLDLQIKYQKMVAAKKTSKISSFSALFLILFALCSSFLLFLSFAFVWWFSDGDNTRMYEGYLIVTGFYAIIAIAFIVFRKTLLVNPVRKFLTDLFFEEAEEEGDETLTRVNLRDEESFNVMLLEEKKNIKEKEEILQEKFKEVEENFSFVNFAKMAIGTIMNSYVTTATVAKLAFKAIGGLKHRKKHLKGK